MASIRPAKRMAIWAGDGYALGRTNTLKAILLPNGRLLIPRPPEDLDEPEGPAVQEIGPEHPDYGRWLATAEPGADPRPEGESPG